MADERDRLVAELALEIRRLTRQTVRYHHAVADQLGIPVTDLLCLGTLRDRGSATPGELATELGLSTGAVSRVLDRLHRDGYLRRRPDPADRRRVIVELTPQAGRAVAGLFAAQAAQLTEAVSGLDPAQLRLLLDHTRDRAAATRDEADRLRHEGRPHASRGGG